MKKRNASQSKLSNARRPDSKRIPVGTILITFVCGCMIVAGIFFAASQHFSSMNIGMQNSKLRKQLDDFQAENRRLSLAKEIAMSPGQVKKLAQEIGMRDSDISGEPIIKLKETKVETAELKENAAKDDEPKIELASVKDSKEKADAPKVLKTVETKSTKSKSHEPAEKKVNLEATKVKSETQKTKDGGSRPRVISTVAKLR